MMNKRRTWSFLATAALIAMLVGGVAVASNMGFKFVPNIGANEFFNLSLPWNNNYTSAKSLYDDLGNAAAVSRINANGTRTSWFLGADPSANFPTQKSEGYLVEANSNGITDAVIVGSHDPNFTLSFNAGEQFNTAAPYHQTYLKANELYDDLNAQLGSSAISSVTRINPNDTRTSWFLGADPSANFDLQLGAAVLVTADQGGSGFVWSHY